MCLRALCLEYHFILKGESEGAVTAEGNFILKVESEGAVTAESFFFLVFLREMLEFCL